MSEIILVDGDQESAALRYKLAQAQKREALVAQVALNIRQSIDLKDICQTVIQEIRQFLKADRAVIYKFNPDMSHRIIAEAIIPPWSSCLTSDLNIAFKNSCLSFSEVEWKKYQEGEIIATADIYEADFGEYHVQMLEQFQVRANIVVPILLSISPNDKEQWNDQFYNRSHDQNLWGLLIIHQCSAPRVWENSEIQLLHQLSVQIAIAIQQSQLIESLQKSKETINLNKIGCWDFDIISGKVRWTQTHFDLLGLDSSASEETYSMWRDRVHPDDLGWVEKALNTALEDHIDLEIEYRIIRPQGNMRWISTKGRGIYDDSGAAIRMVGVMFDVSDRKQLELTLIKEFIRNKAFFDTSFDGICILNSKHHIIESNLSFAKMLGYTTEEITKLNIYDIGAKLTREEIVKMVLKSEETSKPFETLYRRKDGTICNVEISASSVDWDDDLIKFCICRDITQRKLTEISLSQAKEVAEAANRAKSEFLANMSHEIRTPMNGVLGVSQLLATTHLDAEQKDFVKIILDSGDILRAVISDILDFSKIESGNLQLEKKEFNLTDTLNSACDLLKKQAVEKNINLQHQINANIPDRVIGDSLRVRQILINLIGNAIKFTNYGQVLITVHGRFIDSITDGLLYEFSFTIADTGIGIDSDRIDKLFQPFTQADASISRQFGGTGLGLAICKSLIEAMHGTIWVESRGQVSGHPPSGWVTNSPSDQQTQGSIFNFVIALPVGNVDQITTKPNLFTPIEVQSLPIKVLVVEDNIFNQKITLIMLQKFGYQADVAMNGNEAINFLSNQEYDLIFMDVQMPIMDGVTATKIIRENSLSATKPWIVALTAGALPEDYQACINAGMNDYISKPIDIKEIARSLSAPHFLRSLEANLK